MHPLTPKNLQDPTLYRLWQQIEENMEDPQFNTTRLLQIAAMSRTNLYRKLTTKLGMSASALIRHVRLVKAHQMLLEQPELTISEIAIAVGFNSLSYFSRRFTEIFGLCPQEYRKAQLKRRTFLEHT